MTVWTHIGNVQKFSITPTPTVQKHKGTQGPVKAVDFVNTSLIEMAFNCQCDEWTEDNVLMAMLGQAATDTTGAYIKIGVAVVRRQIKFTGANAIGPKWELILPSVNINAREALNFIDTSDETASMPLSGDILFDTTLGAFGTIRSLSGATGGAPIALTTAGDVLNYYTGTGGVYTAPIA
jgi:hypothetical protein